MNKSLLFFVLLISSSSSLWCSGEGMLTSDDAEKVSFVHMVRDLLGWDDGSGEEGFLAELGDDQVDNGLLEDSDEDYIEGSETPYRRMTWVEQLILKLMRFRR